LTAVLNSCFNISGFKVWKGLTFLSDIFHGRTYRTGHSPVEHLRSMNIVEKVHYIGYVNY